MREILFRGKQFDSKGWLFGSLLLTKPWPMISAPGGHIRFVDPETVGQYTGLIDRNGKKIFEGDVVGTIMPHEVRFVCGGWMACRPNECKVMDAAFANGVSVIGNIYDNPELMMEGQVCLF